MTFNGPNRKETRDFQLVIAQERVNPGSNFSTSDQIIKMSCTVNCLRFIFQSITVKILAGI